MLSRQLSRKFFRKAAMSLVASSILLTAIADLTAATTALINGQPVSGFIQGSSTPFTYRNPTKIGTPTERAFGDEYTFSARQGDSVVISVEQEEGSSLIPTLVLLSANNTQVAFDDRSSLLRYRVPTTGEYKLLVLGKNNSRGRYRLSVSGISAPPAAQTSTTDATRRQMLQQEYGLTVLANCPAVTTSLVTVSFVDGNQISRYCANPTRLVRAGEYTYDTTSGDIKPGAPVIPTAGNPSTDPRRQMLQQEYGLTVLENCPPATSSLVVVNFAESGQRYRYCANPNRLMAAGEYEYNATTGDIKPVSTTTPTPATSLDPRREVLQKEFGLIVLQNCPGDRSPFVVVSYPENNQNYVYCAQPNRVFKAGEYVYNTSTRNLEPRQQTQPQQTPQQTTEPPCLIFIPGTRICVIR